MAISIPILKMSLLLFVIVASCGSPVCPYQPILCYTSLLSHSLHQSFPTFQTPLTPLGESNPESHFHSQTLRNQSHQERRIPSLTLRHALEVQLPFFFFLFYIYPSTQTLSEAHSLKSEEHVEGAASAMCVIRWYLLPLLPELFQLL